MSNLVNELLADSSNKKFKGWDWKTNKPFKPSKNNRFTRKKNKKFKCENTNDVNEMNHAMYQRNWSSKKKSDRYKDKEEKDSSMKTEDKELKEIANVINESVQLGQPQPGEHYGGHDNNSLTKTQNPITKRTGEKGKLNGYVREGNVLRQMQLALEEETLDEDNEVVGGDGKGQAKVDEKGGKLQNKKN